MHTHLSLSLLQLCLLLLHPLHKHLPHLVLPLLQLHQELLPLGLVRLLQAAHTHTDSCQSCQLNTRSMSARRVGDSPDRLALRSRVLEAHLLKFAASVQLVVASVRLLSQVLHVDADQHLPQLHKVAVVLVLH